MISALYSIFTQGCSCLRRLVFEPDHPTAKLARYHALFTSRISTLQEQQQQKQLQLSRIVTELSIFDSLSLQAEKIWVASVRALADFLQTLKDQEFQIRPYAIVHEINSLTTQTVEDCERLQMN